MRDFNLIEKTLEYRSKPDPTQSDERFLVSGSKNVLISNQNKFGIRSGYTRYGASNTALTPGRSGRTWNTSTGTELPMRMYDDEWEVYLGTVDGTAINAWKRVTSSLSTTELLRFANESWWDATENLDLMLTVNGSDNVREWNGAVAIVSSITGTTITKTGTATFAQNRFYSARNMTLVNLTTGTEYTYTGGASTTTLTGIADTTGITAGDILIQKVVTNATEPASGRTNHTIFVLENQVWLGSEDDNEVYVSQNDSITDYSFSTPRVAGEGALLTLDAPTRGFGALQRIPVIFSGTSTIYTAEFEQITVSTTLAETLRIKKLKTGVNQSAQNQECITPIGNSLAYLSNEPALRLLEQAQIQDEPSLTTLSDPIQPDFLAEDWTNANQIWYQNALYLTAPVNSRVWILTYQQDADGRLRRYWQPPQILPVRVLTIIAEELYGHSNSVPETYKLFTGLYDQASDDSKLPIHAVGKCAYRVYGKRASYKNFDEYFTEGAIGRNTQVTVTIFYDFGGATASKEFTINGADENIIFEAVAATSLGTQSLGVQPLGGALDAASDTPKFRVIFETPREDFFEMQEIFESNDVDFSWQIFSRGANAKLSSRLPISIKV